MNYFFIVIFHLLLLIIKITNNKTSLILQFKTENPTIKLTPDNYFELKFTNEIKTYFKIGTHLQKLPCYLSINTNSFYISGSNSNLTKDQQKYEEYKSLKYQNISDKIIYDFSYVYGTHSSDQFCINNNQILELKFLLAKNRFSSNELSYSCILGLGYEGIISDEYKEDNYIEGLDSFITQMKNNKIIDEKIFFINYNKEDDNGEIIFGARPHELNKTYCELCTEEDYIEMENTYINDIEIIWSTMGFIYVGEEMIFEYLSSIDFDLNQGFIIGSYIYKDYIEKNFFNNKILNQECFKKEINVEKNILEGFYCKKNVDITKFENLKIFIDKIKYKIEFNYQDLFTEFNGKLYFNVLFTQRKDTFNNYFILGKPFFRKYPMIFNINGRIEKIGFYHNIFVQNRKKEKEESANNLGIYYKISKLNMILIIIGICIICLLIYISFKYLRKPKKQKVNELIEFFDYSSVQK